MFKTQRNRIVGGLLAAAVALVPRVSLAEGGDLSFVEIDVCKDGHRIANFKRDNQNFPLTAQEIAQRMLKLKPHTPEFQHDYFALKVSLDMWDRMPRCP